MASWENPFDVKVRCELTDKVFSYELPELGLQ